MSDQQETVSKKEEVMMLLEALLHRLPGVAEENVKYLRNNRIDEI
jgi:hypothetical protein